MTEFKLTNGQTIELTKDDYDWHSYDNDIKKTVT